MFQVILQCFQAEIKISATVCDMDGVNRRALSILGATMEHPYINLQDNEIVTLFDTPHLLKCFRNLFLKYNIECETNISSDGNIARGTIIFSIYNTLLLPTFQHEMFLFLVLYKASHGYATLRESILNIVDRKTILLREFFILFFCTLKN